MGSEDEAIFDEVQRQYLAPILSKIKAAALDNATAENRTRVNHVDAFRAFEQHFSTNYGSTAAVPKEPSFLRENAFLIIIVAMTLLFGAMGLLPFVYSTSPDASKLGFKPDVFLDMAKLFAGVIVGSAAGSVAAVSKSRAKSP